MEASDVVKAFTDQQPLWVTDGDSMYKITRAELIQNVTEVVKIIFEGDAAALVWLRPRRKRSESCPCVAVFGNRLTSSVHEETLMSQGLRNSRTFLDPNIQQDMERRSRSVPARPTSNPFSQWSVGTPEEPPPHNCKPCTNHHRFLLDTQQGCSNAKCCRFGPACKFCHAWHPELQFSRMRGGIPQEGTRMGSSSSSG